MEKLEIDSKRKKKEWFKKDRKTLIKTLSNFWDKDVENACWFLGDNYNPENCNIFALALVLNVLSKGYRGEQLEAILEIQQMRRFGIKGDGKEAKVNILKVAEILVRLK